MKRKREKAIAPQLPAIKMSEILLEFAWPYAIQDVTDPQLRQNFMNVVVLAWNISLLPNVEHDEAIASFLSKMAARNGCQADDPNLKALENDIRALIIRKTEEYPTIGKFFYKAEVFDDGCQVKCVATTSDYSVLANPNSRCK